MRAAVLTLLDRLAAGGIPDSPSLDVPGLKGALRLGYVASRRIGPPTALYRTTHGRRTRDFSGLAWRHELTARGRAAVGRISREAGYSAEPNGENHR